MASLNKVILMGNITRDIEVRYLQSNQAIATVGLAMNRKFKTADGQLKEEVTFVDCDAWGKTAENIGKFFSKGRAILIEGRLKLDTWKDKNDGSNRSKLKVVIENFHFVDSKGGGGGGGGDDGAPRATVRTQGGGRPQPTAAPTGGDDGGAPQGYEEIQEDDIPF